MLFSKPLTPAQKGRTRDALHSLLQRHQPYGVMVFARDREIAATLAQIIITAASGRGNSRTVQMDEAASVAAYLGLSTGYQRQTATRTLAKIIREEITSDRVIPVFTHVSRMCGGGVQIPEHALMTAN